MRTHVISARYLFTAFSLSFRRHARDISRKRITGLLSTESIYEVKHAYRTIELEMPRMPFSRTSRAVTK